MDINQLFQIAFKAAIEAGEAIMKVYKSNDFDIVKKEDESPLTKADMAAHYIIKEHLETTQLPILSEEEADIAYAERKQWERFWMVDPLDGTKEFINKNNEFTVNIALIEAGVPILGIVYLPVYETLYFGVKGRGSYKFTLGEDSKTILKTRHFEPMPFFVYATAHAWVLPYSETETYTLVGSRSHMNDATKQYMKALEKEHKDIALISKGSSLKICMVAEGNADEYPRFGPTMEWDTAAGHAVALYSGCSFTQENGRSVVYNKEDLMNPYFIVKREK